MIVADSDVLVDALRGQRAARGRIELELKAGALATTAISAFELLSGARSEAERKKVESLLAAMPVLPLDEQAANRAAEVRRGLEGRGAKIGMADYLIAGICLSRQCILLTRNLEHFERVPGLTLGRLSAGLE